jgi:hypothetical protein
MIDFRRPAFSGELKTIDAAPTHSPADPIGQPINLQYRWYIGPAH